MQAWLVSVELIWHRIWECGFGGQSQSSKNKKIKKGWPGQIIFKSFKIEGQEEDTLQKIQKENLILGKILSSPERGGPSPLRSFGTLLGILGVAGMAPVGWSGPCRLAGNLKGAGAGAGAGTPWDGRLQILKAQGKQRLESHLPKFTSLVPEPCLEGMSSNAGTGPESLPSTGPLGSAHHPRRGFDTSKKGHGGPRTAGAQAPRGRTETQAEETPDTSPDPGSTLHVGTFHRGQGPLPLWDG